MKHIPLASSVKAVFMKPLYIDHSGTADQAAAASFELNCSTVNFLWRAVIARIQSWEAVYDIVQASFATVPRVWNCFRNIETACLEIFRHLTACFQTANESPCHRFFQMILRGHCKLFWVLTLWNQILCCRNSHWEKSLIQCWMAQCLVYISETVWLPLIE